MKIEFTKEELIFLLEMISVLNFPGREVERVWKIKKIISDSLKDNKIKGGKENAIKM